MLASVHASTLGTLSKVNMEAGAVHLLKDSSLCPLSSFNDSESIYLKPFAPLYLSIYIYYNYLCIYFLVTKPFWGFHAWGRVTANTKL